MCRSDPPISTVVLRSSGSVGSDIVIPSRAKQGRFQPAHPSRLPARSPMSARLAAMPAAASAGLARVRGPHAFGRRPDGFVTVAVAGRPKSASALLHGFAHHFLDRRDALADLAQAALAQGVHPLLAGGPAQIHRRRAAEDHLAQRFADFHDLVETDAALVAGVVALLAADRP